MAEEGESTVSPTDVENVTELAKTDSGLVLWSNYGTIEGADGSQIVARAVEVYLTDDLGKPIDFRYDTSSLDVESLSPDDIPAVIAREGFDAEVMADLVLNNSGKPVGDLEGQDVVVLLEILKRLSHEGEPLMQAIHAQAVETLPAAVDILKARDGVSAEFKAWTYPAPAELTPAPAPADATPAPAPADATPAEPASAPVEPPADATPAEPIPAEPTPAEPTPAPAEPPADTTPVPVEPEADAAPDEPTPADPVPAEPAPAEPLAEPVDEYAELAKNAAFQQEVLQVQGLLGLLDGYDGPINGVSERDSESSVAVHFAMRDRGIDPHSLRIEQLRDILKEELATKMAADPEFRAQMQAQVTSAVEAGVNGGEITKAQLVLNAAGLKGADGKALAIDGLIGKTTRLAAGSWDGAAPTEAPDRPIYLPERGERVEIFDDSIGLSERIGAHAESETFGNDDGHRDKYGVEFVAHVFNDVAPGLLDPDTYEESGRSLRNQFRDSTAYNEYGNDDPYIPREGDVVFLKNYIGEGLKVAVVDNIVTANDGKQYINIVGPEDKSGNRMNLQIPLEAFENPDEYSGERYGNPDDGLSDFKIIGVGMTQELAQRHEEAALMASGPTGGGTPSP